MSKRGVCAIENNRPGGEEPRLSAVRRWFLEFYERSLADGLAEVDARIQAARDIESLPLMWRSTQLFRQNFELKYEHTLRRR